jgi:molybdate transport system substrate-binding protein
LSDTLHFLCAGAVQGIVKGLEGRFTAETGARLQGRFGAVGAMKEALLAGEPCDVFIVTDKMVGELGLAGILQAQPASPPLALGRVRTAIAARSGEPVPAVGDTEALRAALRAAPALYFPDPERATAGIHFAKVLAQLGIKSVGDSVPRWCTFPNGATAMRALATEAVPGSLGCTQASEIMYTPGVHLVGALPAQFELATVYSAAISAHAAAPKLAQSFMALLASAESATLRANGGFDL